MPPKKELSLDEQMAVIAQLGDDDPRERALESVPKHYEIPVRGRLNLVVITLQDGDIQLDDFRAAGLFVGERFVKDLRGGDWHQSGGGNYGPKVALGKVLERSLLNQAAQHGELKDLLKTAGYSFNEST